jgi:Domain of unknown function (DUF4210)
LIYISLSSAAGEAVEHNSSCITKHKFSANHSFHPQAQLSLSKFRNATTPNGTLYLRVISDSSLSGFSSPPRGINFPTLSKLTIYENEATTSSANNFGSIISSGSFSPPNDSPISKELPNRNPSPFPSPAMKKKVLNFAESRLCIPSKSSIFKSPTSPTRSSNLQFGFTTNSLTDQNEDFNEESNETNTVRETRLYSPDGIELAPSQPQSRRGSIPPLEPYGTFVGSYEESILIGRLSTTPSKPIPFIAEIGVLAIGKCKPQLKCPAHVILSFPAYFYQLDENTPTPYVGTIDLDELRASYDSFCLEDCAGYRLPFKGQLQIVRHYLNFR